MRIGLIDVDGHNFPNLALMRISSFHKQRGDTVEWWWSDFVHYDIVYMSKIFSDTYTADVPEPLNADRVIKGGTGYCIHLGNDGKEHFDKSKNTELPPEIERCFPDYSIYPQFPFAVSMTSRGCPRGCAFCHVAAKEGRCAKKVADVSDFSLLLDTSSGRDKRLRRYLAENEGVLEFVVVDCAPDIDMASINALMAADLAIVPITLDKNARKGLAEVWEQIEAAQQENPKLKAYALITRFRPDQKEKIADVTDLDLLGTVIRESTQKVENGNDAGKPLSLYSRWSTVTRTVHGSAVQTKI